MSLRKMCQPILTTSISVDNTGKDLSTVFAPYHVNHNFIRPSIFGLYLIQRASGFFLKQFKTAICHKLLDVFDTRQIIFRCVKFLPFLNIMTVVTYCNSLHNQIFLNFEMGGNFSFISIKQMFQFENFRVRKLRAINALNFYITLCMAFLAMISMESETSAVKVSIIKSADPVKRKVYFCYYRLAKGCRGRQITL